MILPLIRFNRVHQETIENIAKMMIFEVDCAPSFGCSSKGDVIEQKSSQLSNPNRPWFELSYYLKHDPFDDSILNAIARTKLNASYHSFRHTTPAPLLEHLDHSPTEEEAKSDNIPTGKFVHVFFSNYLVYLCALLRTLPTLGHMVLSNDYFCTCFPVHGCGFWRRGRVITQDYKMRIPMKDIGQVRQAGAFEFTRFGIAMDLAGVPDICLDFSSRSMREEVMHALECHAQAAKVEEKRINRRLSHMPLPKPLGQNTKQIKLTTNRETRQTHENRLPRHWLLWRRPTVNFSRQAPQYLLLIQGGHTVTIASHPEYRPWVESLGIRDKDVGGDPAALMKLSLDLACYGRASQLMAKRDAENPVDLTGKDASVKGTVFVQLQLSSYAEAARLARPCRRDCLLVPRSVPCEDQVLLMYIGFCSVTVSGPAAVTKAIYGAVVQSGVQAIVAIGWSERGSTKNTLDDAPIEPPPQVFDLHSFPHDWLFPQVDAVCHHGGAGTTGMSLRYVFPTLIHPFLGGVVLFFCYCTCARNKSSDWFFFAITCFFQINHFGLTDKVRSRNESGLANAAMSIGCFYQSDWKPNHEGQSKHRGGEDPGRRRAVACDKFHLPIFGLCTRLGLYFGLLY
ncbi:uncharacterized protein VP01_1841g6 [Puccinia sorghi]|uniref:Uncharacterized protein n=1 Tax=Puccinia sorghi TaxID=27349 RepID=A0A0L6VDS2_9BASI|nr:uncharacterized protein VP01_1841g6 [Puccinia sorghi]